MFLPRSVSGIRIGKKIPGFGSVKNESGSATLKKIRYLPNNTNIISSRKFLKLATYVMAKEKIFQRFNLAQPRWKTWPHSMRMLGMGDSGSVKQIMHMSSASCKKKMSNHSIKPQLNQSSMETRKVEEEKNKSMC